MCSTSFPTTVEEKFQSWQTISGYKRKFAEHKFILIWCWIQCLCLWWWWRIISWTQIRHTVRTVNDVKKESPHVLILNGKFPKFLLPWSIRGIGTTKIFMVYDFFLRKFVYFLFFAWSTVGRITLELIYWNHTTFFNPF